MTPDQIFAAAGPLAMSGWLILIFAGRRKWAAGLVSGVVVPLLFAIVYTALIATHWGESRGGFSTLDAVALLFQNRWLLLAGWIHYLAFDLFIGSWETRDAARLGISHWFVVPCLLLTFIFGPADIFRHAHRHHPPPSRITVKAKVTDWCRTQKALPDPWERRPPGRTDGAWNGLEVAPAALAGADRWRIPTPHVNAVGG